MLARSIPARALATSRLAARAPMQLRHISIAARPSAVALGKRPVLAPRGALLGAAGGVGSLDLSRNLSWTPWKSSKPEVPEAASAPAPPAASADVSTPIPSSDTPALPAEHKLAPAQHLTSTAPDHQFHSDPTPLLPQHPANAQTPTLEDLITNSGLPLDQVLNSPEAVHAAMKVSDLKLMGLEHGVFNIAGWLRDAVVGMHDVTGLPWWASIVALTLSMRLCLFPLLVRTTRHNVRMSAVSPQFNGIMKRMKEAQSAGDQVGQAIAAENLRTLMKEHDVSPFRGLQLPLISMPIFLGMFFAIRKLATLPLPQLKEGGFGWVTDLTIPDPLFILPLTSICFQIAVFQMGADGTGGGAQTPSAQRNMAHFRNVFLAMSPIMAYFVSGFPAALLFYWTTTNMFTLLQAWSLRQPFVRRILNIPTPKQLPPPPEDAYVNPNPGLKETFRAILDWQGNMMDKARARQAEARAAAVERERRQALRPGMGMLADKVNEPSKTAEKKATKVSSFLESGNNPAATGSNTAAATRREQKRRRIEEAREKRASQ